MVGAGSLFLLAPYGCGSEESGEAGSSGKTRTIEHKLGTSEIPISPGAVVALDYASLEGLLALGADVAGAVDPSQVLTDEGRGAEGLESVGDVLEPNLENVAAIGPDLIIGVDFAAEQIYDRLSQIAPTVVVAEENSYGDWKGYLSRLGEISDREEKAEELLGGFESRIERFKERMGAELEEIETSIIRFVEAAPVFVYGPASFCGSVVEEAGLPRPASQNVEEEQTEISRETLDLAEGDAIFYFASGTSDERASRDKQALDEFVDDPLWQRLEAVQNGRAYEVGDHWLGSNIVAANLILDDLERYLLEGEAS